MILCAALIKANNAIRAKNYPFELRKVGVTRMKWVKRVLLPKKKEKEKGKA